MKCDHLDVLREDLLDRTPLLGLKRHMLLPKVKHAARQITVQMGLTIV